MWGPSLWNWSIDGILDHGQEIWSMKVLRVMLRANIDVVCVFLEQWREISTVYTSCRFAR